MATYRGEVNCRSLGKKLKDILVEEGYTEVGTNPNGEGFVLRSKGKEGKNDFVIRIQDPVSNNLAIGVYERYTPGNGSGLDGVFGVGVSEPGLFWNGTSNDRFNVDYIVVANLDRVIIHVQAKAAETNSPSQTLMYVGMPYRYDKEDVSCDFASVAANRRGSISTVWRALRDRNKRTIRNYTYGYYEGFHPIAADGRVVLSQITLFNTEGARGELEGLFTIPKSTGHAGVVHKEEFSREGKRYVIIRGDEPAHVTGSASLPDMHYAIEI